MNDEEILLRHFHTVIGDYVQWGEKQKTLQNAGADR